MVLERVITSWDSYAEVEDSEGEGGGLKKSEVVNWYLEEIQEEIESEAELVQKKAIVEKVLDRLIYHVSLPHSYNYPHSFAR